MPGYLRCATLLSILCSACEARKPDTSTVTIERWALADSATVDIGVELGDEHYELQGARSALRLPDGRIVVGNTGSSELRFYDATGKFLYSRGRKGQGPSEFSWRLDLYQIGQDTIAVFDGGSGRLSLFDSAGKFLDARSIELRKGAPPGLDIWLHGRNRIRAPLDSSSRGSILQAVDQMGDPPDGQYRFVLRAEDGALWTHVRPVGIGTTTVEWQVYSPEGTLRGRVTLPRAFELYQASQDLVLGRTWGEADEEHIQLFGVRKVGSEDVVIPPKTTASNSAKAITAGGFDEMKKVLVGMVMAQEMYYADHAGYAQRTEDLREGGKWETPETITVDLLESDKGGWIAMAVQRGRPGICGMAVGTSTPPGWPEGSPVCSSAD